MRQQLKADFVVVSNRLPVDRDSENDSWRVSPGGLVAALAPVMRQRGGAWVGWPGKSDLELKPFVHGSIQLVPVSLSAEEVEEYYEGFSNDTLWPLFHDVIAAPSYHREWWVAYRTVNERFARAAAAVADHGATVWVQDYQLLLVPQLLRELRPDLVIGFFCHIPFPAYGLYSQLPWRRQILDGVLGADVIGFQRPADASNFASAVRRLLRYNTRQGIIEVPDLSSISDNADDQPGIRTVVSRPFPISIDTARIIDMAKQPEVQERARQIRHELGDPKRVLFGVDRLDYTKGILHRLKAYGELLDEGRIDSGDVVLVQVASPSREAVEHYQQLRDEVELTVGRINGSHSDLGHPAISYLHHGYPMEEMVALYLASDVMLVTALRDGMNLVAKEYVASRIDNDGVLVLSEFAGASDELKQATKINPHDIEGLKDAIVDALEMDQATQSSRMRSMRRRVREYDVQRWSGAFLAELERARHV